METTFGEYLLAAIQMRNLSQKEAARILNLSPQTLNNYILNKRTPDLYTLSHILEVFPLEADSFFSHHKNAHHACTQDEVELLRIYRELDPRQRKFILLMLKELPK